MLRFIGVILVIAGLVGIYLFGAHGMAVAKAMTPSPSGSMAELPFKVLGKNYPKDALSLAGGAGALACGLWLLLRGGKTATDSPGASVPTGTFARGFFALGLGACVAWWIAYVGAVTGAPAAAVGGFVAVAGLAIVEAFLLAILSFFEKPKPAAALVLGWLVFLAAVGVGVAGMLGGK